MSPGSGPRRPSIMRAVSDHFRQDPAYRQILDAAKAEKKSKAKAKRAKGKRN